MKHEQVWLDTAQQVRIDSYLPEVYEEINPQVKRPAILVCPGGGYEWTSTREGEPVALRFAGMGFNTYVVWYRVAPNRFPVPQQDVGAAIAWIRHHAAEQHTDPDRIAVMGFSAGGHVAGSLGVLWPHAELWAPMGLSPEEVRPNALVLCYPVISGGEWAHRGSFVNLTGTEEEKTHAAYSLDESVRQGVTPPTFLWHTWDDGAVPVMNTLLMAQALAKEGIQAEVHIFDHGGHGSSLCDETTTTPGREADQLLPHCQGWPALAAAFLKRNM